MKLVTVTQWVPQGIPWEVPPDQSVAGKSVAEPAGKSRKGSLEPRFRGMCHRRGKDAPINRDVPQACVLSPEICIVVVIGISFWETERQKPTLFMRRKAAVVYVVWRA
jgi:hypothetical protein